MKEIGIDIGKGSQVDKGVKKSWEGQQLQLGWISKEKLVQLWLGNQPLEVLLKFFSTTSEVLSSLVDPLSDSSADLLDSEGTTQPKYPCKISKREDVSIPARAIFI